MSDFAFVVRRIETDYDFELAVRATPDRTLGQYDLTEQERRAFGNPSNIALWQMVGRAVRRSGTGDTLGGDPHPPPSGVVLPPPPPSEHPRPRPHHDANSEWERDQLLDDPQIWSEDTQVLESLKAVRTATDAATRLDAIKLLLERIE
jgi:hypothetical protein